MSVNRAVSCRFGADRTAVVTYEDGTEAVIETPFTVRYEYENHRAYLVVERPKHERDANERA